MWIIWMLSRSEIIIDLVLSNKIYLIKGKHNKLLTKDKYQYLADLIYELTGSNEE